MGRKRKKRTGPAYRDARGRFAKRPKRSRGAARRPKRKAPPAPTLTPRQKAARAREARLRQIQSIHGVDRGKAMEIRKRGLWGDIKGSAGEARKSYTLIRGQKYRSGRYKGQQKFRDNETGRIVPAVNVRRAEHVARYWAGIRKLREVTGMTTVEARRAVSREVARKKRRGVKPVMGKGYSLEWETVLTLIYEEEHSGRGLRRRGSGNRDADDALS